MTKAKTEKIKKTRHNSAVRTGDKVVCVAGNDRGRSGEVLSRTNDRVIVKGLNVRKKHVRRSEVNPQGGVIEIERPIHISNVMLAGKGDKPAKVKCKTNKNGERELVLISEGKETTHRPVKKAQ